MIALWVFPLISALVSLSISSILIFRWWKTKNESIFYWGFGFFSYFFSQGLSTLMMMISTSGYLKNFLVFSMESFETIWVVAVYYGTIILITEKKVWRVWVLVLLAIGVQSVTAYSDLILRSTMISSILRILLFLMPFSLAIGALFLYHWVIDGKKYSLLISLGWFEYVIILPIFFLAETDILLSGWYATRAITNLILLIGFLGYIKTRSIEPLIEIAPKAEITEVKEIVAEPKYDLRKGCSYIVKEQKADNSFEIFCDQVFHGTKGLCITREHPDVVREKYGLERTPIVWLCVTPGKHNLKPTNIGRLTDTIKQFTEKGEDAVILLDGIEYLITHNGFNLTLKAIDFVNETMMIDKSIFIMSIDPRAVKERELALLEKNMDVPKVKTHKE